MPSENFDNKIKEAADQHHPDYDGNAWAKMEKMLDRHLPQNNDRRRRFIFFLLFLLCIGGGAWLLISKPWKQNNQTLSTVNAPGKKGEAPSVVSTEEKKERSTAENSMTGKKVSEEVNKESIAEPVIENPVAARRKNDILIIDKAVSSKPKINKNISEAIGNKKTGNDKRNKLAPGKSDKADQLTVDIADAETSKKDKNLPANNTIVTLPGNNNDKVVKDVKIKTQADQPVGNDVSLTKPDPTKEKTTETKKDKVTEQPKPTDKKDIAKKSSGKKSNSLVFSFSAGPDLSFVRLDYPGKVKLLTGAGIGYTIKDRLTIRTGFYSASKVYEAKPDEYKPSTPLPPYLQNVSANCKVYEIPLTLAWNFGQSEKYKIFAAAGLSSFIMKKEEYNYMYLYPGSTQPYYYKHTVDNKYKHYFSVLSLSAGYQRRISKTFSITAEPYFKLPLAGVGYGKIKLNSAGILFSVNISPFQHGAKK